MTQAVARLLAEAMSLSETERDDLAGRLIEGLDAAADANAEADWSAEVQTRLEELRTAITVSTGSRNDLGGRHKELRGELSFPAASDVGEETCLMVPLLRIEEKTTE